MYKMAVVDIDGTLSSGGNYVSDRVIDAVHRTIQKGVPVCVCTGRNYGHTKPVMDRLDIDTPFTTIDGLVTFSSDKIIYEKKLGSEILNDIAQIAGRENVYIESVANEDYNKFTINAKEYDYGLSVVNPRAKYYDTFDDFLKIVPETYEFIFGGKDENVRRVSDKIMKKHGGMVGIRDSLWAGFIFVAAPQSGKAFGVRRLCEHYGFDMSEVVAIGDDLNDIDMLEQAGMGVAMGNAVPRAKDAADYVTDTVGNDGVALALEKFFL